ncbi:MAG: hypothetical protein K2K57_07095 [Oscillospiraceae bacterium]|nr:hypothetical protein [Oscillospiraceae bacterium]
MNVREPIEYKIISSNIEKKLAGADLTADDLFRGHLHYGDKFTDPTGIYIVRRKNGYEIYHLGIRGIESVKKLSTEDEVVFRIICDGITDYAYRAGGYNSRKRALELLKMIDIDYYNEVIKQG